MPEKWKISPFEGGKLGLHLTVNPRKPLAVKDRLKVNPKINKIFQQHGMVLKGHELQSLMLGREKGIKTIQNVLGKLIPYGTLNIEDRQKLAIKIADVLMEKSLEGQLSRTVPTLLQQNEQRELKLQEMFRQQAPADSERGGLQDLIKKVPIGISVKVHLPVDWL